MVNNTSFWGFKVTEHSWKQNYPKSIKNNSLSYEILFQNKANTYNIKQIWQKYIPRVCRAC